MRSQADVLPADIGLNCTNEELSMILQKLMNGSLLPRNVINDLNPYQYLPSNLPSGSFWYLIRSNESKDTSLGCWRTKEEACKIFSNSIISGWRATLEFYEGRVPHERKTNWVMQEYWLTQKIVSLNSKPKDTSVLCRVQSTSCEPKSNCKSLEKLVTSCDASHSTQLVVSVSENRHGDASASNTQVINNETGTLTVTQSLPEHHVDIMAEIEMDDIFSRGDYLELLDLDRPGSFSSSSDSSCVTMSIDECFDSLALLEELDHSNRQNQVNNINTGCNYSVSLSQRPVELVMYAATSSSESLSKSTSKEMVKSHSLIPICDERNEGVSKFHAAIPQEIENKATVVRTKKLKKKKYFCFIPF